MVNYNNEEDVNTLLGQNCTSPGQLDFANIKQFTVKGRYNLVTLENMARPGEDPVPEWDAPDFDNLIDNIVEARQNGTSRCVVYGRTCH